MAPRFYSPANITVTDDFEVKGLTLEQGVALFSSVELGSQYYVDLLAAGKDSTDYTEEELALVTDDDLKPIVKKYAEDEEALIEAFTSGWTYLMTADRFKVSPVYSIVCIANFHRSAVVLLASLLLALTKLPTGPNRVDRTNKIITPTTHRITATTLARV